MDLLQDESYIQARGEQSCPAVVRCFGEFNVGSKKGSLRSLSSRPLGVLRMPLPRIGVDRPGAVGLWTAFASWGGDTELTAGRSRGANKGW